MSVKLVALASAVLAKPNSFAYAALVGSLIFCALIPTSSQAQVLPSFSGTVTIDPPTGSALSTDVNGFGQTQQTSANGTSASATVNVNAAPNPSVNAASSSVGGGYGAHANVILQYDLEVLQLSGPATSSVLVDMTANGSLSAPVTTDNNNQAYVSLNVGGTLLGYADVTSGVASLPEGDRPGLSGSFNPSAFTISVSGSNALQIPIGQEILVTLDADTNAGGTYSGSASAYLDPFFFFDISLQDPQDFSIVVTPGTFNEPVAGVPEPSTWAMMLLGFCGLGFMAYRRRSSAMLAA